MVAANIRNYEFPLSPTPFRAQATSGCRIWSKVLQVEPIANDGHKFAWIAERYMRFGGFVGHCDDFARKASGQPGVEVCDKTVRARIGRIIDARLPQVPDDRSPAPA
jgi:hypothetical protein